MKKYIIGLKDDQLNIGFASVNGKKTKIIKEAQIQNENIGRMLDTCALAVSEELKSQLAEFLVTTKSKSNKVDVVIGLESIISRTIEIPYLNKKNLKTYLENNISTFFTVNMAEYFYDFKVLRIVKKTKEAKKMMTIMVVVIPTPIIKGIKNLVESVGLELSSVRIYPDIMLRAIRKNENVCILDIGNIKTLVTIYENGTAFLYTTVNTQIDFADENPYEDFVDEVEYFTDFYSSRHQGEKLDAIYTFGEYHQEESFQNYVAERLGTSLKFIDYNSNRRYASRVDIDAHPQMVISQIKRKEIFDKEIDFNNEKKLYDVNKKAFLPIHFLFILIILTVAFSGAYWYYLGEQAILYSSKIPESTEFINIQEELNVLNETIKVLEAKEVAVDEILSNQYNYNEMLSLIQKAVPKGVTISTVIMTKDVVDIVFNINQETMLAIELIVSLNELDYFEDINVAEIELDNNVETLSFQLIVKKLDEVKDGE